MVGGFIVETGVENSRLDYLNLFARDETLVGNNTAEPT